MLRHRALRLFVRGVSSFFFQFRLLHPVWFFYLNKKARQQFFASMPVLDSVSARIVSELRFKGIALTHLSELFPERPELLLLLQVEMQQQRDSYAGKTETSQAFLSYLWDFIPELDVDDAFIQLSLHERILDIVNSYMQMWSRFYLFTLNVTHPVGPDATATTSQLWHRDADDKKICKMFLYLNDVDHESGPFVYIPETAYGQKHTFLYSLPGAVPQEGVACALVKKQIETQVCVGKAGTIIFCDTAGIHKGGYATHNERVMFTASYRSSSAYLVSRFRYGKKASDSVFRATLSPKVNYTLEYNKNPFASWLYSLYTQKKSEKKQRSYERKRN